MSILSAQSIRHAVYLSKQLIIRPFVVETKQTMGLSYGLSAASYDIRIGKIGVMGTKLHTQARWVKPGEFILLASLEYVELPNDLAAYVHDKSTLARKGLALQNTFIDPGFKGWITLELSNHSAESVQIKVGQPIAQLVFHTLDQPTEMPYKGKYQNQSANPTPAIEEEPTSGQTDHP